MSSAWPPGPTRLSAPAGEVHVWRAELDAGETSAAGLPAAERRRAERIRRPEAERAWIASRWALRTVLGRYRDEEPAAIALKVGEHGKPALAGPAVRLDFNLSHSGSLALIAVASELGLGIDVERMEPGRDFLALAERGLGPDGAALLREREPADRTSAFYAAWVRREALLKCGGGGFGSAVPERAVTVRELEIDPGYAAALAVAGTDAVPFRCFSLGSP